MAVQNFGLAYTYAGNQWAYGVPIDLTSATGNGVSPILDVVASVSCTSQEFCMAITESGYSFTYVQGRWSSATAIAQGGAGFSDVSCGSPSFCVALNGSTAYTYDAGVWTSASTLGANREQLASVSCAAAFTCVAVGDPTDATGTSDGGNAFVLANGTWTEVRFWPLDLGYQMTSVSCPEVDFCIATDSQGQALTMDGESWTITSVAADIVSLSCPSRSFCIGLDLSGYVHAYRSGTWEPRLLLKAPAGTTFEEVSCGSSKLCVVVATSDVAYVHTASSLQA